MAKHSRQIAILAFVVASVLGDASLVASSGPPKNETERLQRAWRTAITRTLPPAKGCFRASYPIALWRQVKCVRAPQRPYLPASGAPVAGITGNGNDYAAVSKTLISFAAGSFPQVKHLKWERGTGGQANVYSLQLNSNFMPNDPACAGAANPAACLGWEQFVYSSGSGAAFIQYWLIHYGNQCPKNWMSHDDSCYSNSDAVQVPLQPITEMPNLKLSGHAAERGINAVVLTTKTGAYSTTGSDNIVYLAEDWNAAEFNVFGDCCGSEATFNAGAALTIEIELTNGSTKKIKCQPNSGTTAETNSLSLVKCKAADGANPSVQFTERQGKFTQFDPPGSTATNPIAINDAGAIAGSYYDSNNSHRGFVRNVDGTFSTFDVPGSTSTSVSSINNEGVIAGTYYSGANRGFMRAADGTITTFDVPGSGATFASSINAGNSIAGYYYTGTFHGFLRTPDGTFTSFDPSGSTVTYVTGINTTGSIAGFYFSDVPHGFLRAPDGTITIIDITGSHGTEVGSINSGGTIAGDFSDGKTEHAFVRATDGTTILFDPPGSTYTDARWVNDYGAITGIYWDSNGATHSYMRAADGTITSVDFPGSIYTEALGINVKGAITGNYQDSKGVAHGFLGIP